MGVFGDLIANNLAHITFSDCYFQHYGIIFFKSTIKFFNSYRQKVSLPLMLSVHFLTPPAKALSNT